MLHTCNTNVTPIGRDSHESAAREEYREIWQYDIFGPRITHESIVFIYSIYLSDSYQQEVVDSQSRLFCMYN